MAIIRNRAFAIRLIFEHLRVWDSFPLSKGRLRINLGLAFSDRCEASIRYAPTFHLLNGWCHQIPAHKHKRGSVSEIHCVSFRRGSSAAMHLDSRAAFRVSPSLPVRCSSIATASHSAAVSK